MTLDFASLKKSSKNSIQKLNDELVKLNPKKSYDDDKEGVWYPAADKTGNGEAIIRFLPAPPGEDVPFVRLFSHGFEHEIDGVKTGQWFIDNCPTTIGKTCPVCEHNNKLWNSGIEDNKKAVSRQKRKLGFTSNIYVIKDKLNPENEGKVFKFQYGKKIFDMLNAQMNPEFEDEQPINPFDLWAGANFRLRFKKVAGYRNYDTSRFDEVSPLMDNDDAMEVIWKQCYPLQPLVAESKFKSHEELKARLHRVLALDTPAPSKKSAAETPPWEDEQPVKAAAKKPSAAPKKMVEDSEDDDLDSFRNLMDDDE